MIQVQQLERLRTVDGKINYAVDNGGVNRFHANDSSLDTFAYDPRTVAIVDARTVADAPRLDREGYALMRMPTAVADFRDRQAIEAVHGAEIIRFIQGLGDADEVVLAGPGALRFGERAAAEERAGHSKTARLIHSDAGLESSAAFSGQYNPRPERRIVRTAHHNIWRTFSPPPQDLPLALCDFRSVEEGDVITQAEAAFDDAEGRVGWSFQSMLFRYNPRHRWSFFSNMERDEVLVFKRHDSDCALPWFVPHTAFSDPSAPADAVPRASIEMRTISYWYE